MSTPPTLRDRPPMTSGPTGRPNDVPDDVQAYVDAIPPEHRPLFDRVAATIRAVRPDATVRLSYGMPTYGAGGRRLYVGAWRHGLSLYGWSPGEDGGLTERHPDLVTGKGTVRLRPEDAADIPDEELTTFVRFVLGG
jgi:uncharacterized protein YdhG (YjbR/CyaY superfamily)